MTARRMGVIPSRSTRLVIGEDGGVVRVRCEPTHKDRPGPVTLALFPLDSEGDAEDVLVVKLDPIAAARIGGDLIAAARDAGLAMDAHREGRRAYRGEV